MIIIFDEVVYSVEDGKRFTANEHRPSDVSNNDLKELPTASPWREQRFDGIPKTPDALRLDGDLIVLKG